MLTVHHLGISQSERIVWLCEELGLDYELKRYDRRADNRLAPGEYKSLHPMGTRPNRRPRLIASSSWRCATAGTSPCPTCSSGSMTSPNC